MDTNLSAGIHVDFVIKCPKCHVPSASYGTVGFRRKYSLKGLRIDAVIEGKLAVGDVHICDRRECMHECRCQRRAARWVVLKPMAVVGFFRRLAGVRVCLHTIPESSLVLRHGTKLVRLWGPTPSVIMSEPRETTVTRKWPINYSVGIANP